MQELKIYWAWDALTATQKQYVWKLTLSKDPSGYVYSIDSDKEVADCVDLAKVATDPNVYIAHSPFKVDAASKLGGGRYMAFEAGDDDQGVWAYAIQFQGEPARVKWNVVESTEGDEYWDLGAPAEIAAQLVELLRCAVWVAGRWNLSKDEARKLGATLC